MPSRVGQDPDRVPPLTDEGRLGFLVTAFKTAWENALRPQVEWYMQMALEISPEAHQQFIDEIDKFLATCDSPPYNEKQLTEIREELRPRAEEIVDRLMSDWSDAEKGT